MTLWVFTACSPSGPKTCILTSDAASTVMEASPLCSLPGSPQCLDCPLRMFKIPQAEAVFPPKLCCCWHIELKQISSLGRSLKSCIVLATWKGLSDRCPVALFTAAKYFGRAGALVRFLLYARAKHFILDRAMTHSSVYLSGVCSVQQPSDGTLCDLWLGPIPGAEPWLSLLSVQTVNGFFPSHVWYYCCIYKHPSSLSYWLLMQFTSTISWPAWSTSSFWTVCAFVRPRFKWC